MYNSILLEIKTLFCLFCLLPYIQILFFLFLLLELIDFISNYMYDDRLNMPLDYAADAKTLREATDVVTLPLQSFRSHLPYVNT